MRTLRIYSFIMIFMATLLLVVVLRLQFSGRNINVWPALIPIGLGYLAGFITMWVAKLK